MRSKISVLLIVFFSLFLCNQSDCTRVKPEVGTITVMLSDDTPTGTLPSGYEEFGMLSNQWDVKNEDFEFTKLMVGVSGYHCLDEGFITLDGKRLDITKTLVDQTMYELNNVVLKKGIHLLQVSADVKCAENTPEEGTEIRIQILGYEAMGLTSGETLYVFPDEPVLTGGQLIVHEIDYYGASLRITRSANSPTGYFPLAKTGQKLACFDAWAYGDDIFVTMHNVKALLSDDKANMRNGFVEVDGGVISSSTKELDTDATDTSTYTCLPDDKSGEGTNDSTCFDMKYMVRFGETRQVCVVADLLDPNGFMLESPSTVIVSLNPGGDNGTSNARGRFSGKEFSTNGVSGNLLTLVGSNVTAYKNPNIADGSSLYPSATLGGIAPMSVITVGPTAEGSDSYEYEIVDELDGGDSLADYFSQLELRTDISNPSTRIGEIVVPVDISGTVYKFTTDVPVSQGPLEQKPIYLLGYVRRSIRDFTDINMNDMDGEVRLQAIRAIGQTTKSSVSISGQRIALQNLYLVSHGNVAVSLDPSSPRAQNVSMGDENVVFLSTRVKTSSAEGVYHSRFVYSDKTIDPGAIQDLGLYDKNNRRLAPLVYALSNVHSGTSTYGSPDFYSLCLDYTSHEQDNAYKGMPMFIFDGTGRYQSTIINGFDVVGSECDRMVNFAPAFGKKADSTSRYVIGSQAIFELYEPLSIPKSGFATLVVKGKIVASPNAVSGVKHEPMLTDGSGALSGYDTRFYGADSQLDILADGYPVVGQPFTVYQTGLRMTKSQVSPSGTSVATSEQEVLRWRYDNVGDFSAGIFPANFTLSGSSPYGYDSTLTGRGSAKIYRINNDPTDEWRTLWMERQAKVLMFDAGVDTGEDFVFVVKGNKNSACTGIPQNANVNVWDFSASSYVYDSPFLVTSVDTLTNGDCRISFHSNVFDFDSFDTLEYFPAYPGLGELTFGGHSEFFSDLVNNATSVRVENTKGFSVGDRLYLHNAYKQDLSGFITIVGGCVVTSIVDDQNMTTTPCQLSVDQTVRPGYNNIYVTKSYGQPVLSTFSAPQEIFPGEYIEYILVLDTTGLNTNDTLRVDITGDDQYWTDFLVGLIKMGLGDSVIGGTLIY